MTWRAGRRLPPAGPPTTCGLRFFTGDECQAYISVRLVHILTSKV